MSTICGWFAIAYSTALRCMSTISLMRSGFSFTAFWLADTIMLSGPIGVEYGYSTSLPVPLARLMPAAGSAPT